jgi:hypothetical protein
VRAERDPGNAKQTRLVMVQPTAAELRLLALLGDELKKEKLVDDAELWREGPAYRGKQEQVVVVRAKVEEVGKLLAKYTRPGKQVLTAIELRGGEVRTVEGAGVELEEALDAIEREKKEAEKAATVKRPTPCCPTCEPGSIGPAREVLLDFLTHEQHEDWSRYRALVAVGGETGHRYLIAHRNSALAVRWGKICLDADDRVVMHFHDWGVPPEEEVLAAKLILEHRESWLRNEATYFGFSTDPLPFDLWGERLKNPFGDGGDGLDSTFFTSQIGADAQPALAAELVLRALGAR